MADWTYQGKIVRTMEQVEKILGHKPYGFIYLITLENTEDPMQPYTYYGQKTMLTDAKRIVGQRELKEKGKGQFKKYKSKSGKKKGQWVYFEERKEETWINYPSSSDVVKQMIEDGISHTKEILEFTTQKSLLNWKETQSIICNGCLEDKYCLNKRIGNYHSRNIINALKKDEI